jgi:hypothetical protein
LHVNDIFPVATTGDWVVIDAPVPALQAWANGADADITTLETEMDAVEVRVDALEAGGASAPVTESVYVNSSYRVLLAAVHHAGRGARKAFGRFEHQLHVPSGPGDLHGGGELHL